MEESSQPENSAAKESDQEILIRLCHYAWYYLSHFVFYKHLIVVLMPLGPVVLNKLTPKKLRHKTNK